MVKKYAGTVAEPPAGEEIEGLPSNQANLTQILDKSRTECLNQSDDHVLEHALAAGDGYLESDCDEQLLITMAFTQRVKVHSLYIAAQGNQAPKDIKVFANLPNTPSFDAAEGMEGVQKFELAPEDMKDNNLVLLKYVKFQNVDSITIFVANNQGGEETTRIDRFAVIGSPVATVNMEEFKRVAGKKGESH